MAQSLFIKADEVAELLGVSRAEAYRVIKKATGLWHYQTSRDEVRCLCISCLHEYVDTNSYIISRLDPFQREKETCDRYGRLIYDYTLRAKKVE